MTDRKTDADEKTPSRRPVASASVGTFSGLDREDKEAAYANMVDISLSLMSYFGSELQILMRECPDVAVQVGPMLRVMSEVTSDIEAHRLNVDAL